MRRGRGRNDERADPNLIPLLDVVLQLIAFFMMLVHFGSRLEGASDAVRLPTAPSALPTTDLGFDRLSIIVDEAGRLRVGDRAYEDRAMVDWWRAEAQRRRDGLKAVGRSEDQELPTVVVVRADRGAPYGAIRRLLAVAQQEGFHRFTLVVLRENRP